jgi:hypothetical protein
VLLLVEVSVGIETNSLAEQSDGVIGHPSSPGFSKWD